MDIKEYNDFYHVDISTQINNKWKEDSVLGIVKDSKKRSIRIKGRDKIILKERFIFKDPILFNRIHNQKVICIIYSYLFYKLLCEIREANPIMLCRDVRPEKFILNYFQKIASYFNNKEFLNKKIIFRKRIEFEIRDKLPKSLAGKYVRKVYQGKIKSDKTLDKEEIEELTEIINKLL